MQKTARRTLLPAGQLPVFGGEKYVPPGAGTKAAFSRAVTKRGESAGPGRAGQKDVSRGAENCAPAPPFPPKQPSAVPGEALFFALFPPRIRDPRAGSPKNCRAAGFAGLDTLTQAAMQENQTKDRPRAVAFAPGPVFFV